MEIMKISDAIEIYKNKQLDCVDEDYKELVRLVRESRIKDPIKNSNYSHALYLTDLMFGCTTESLRIFCGNGGDGFLTALKDSFEKAVKRVIKNGGTVKIILLADSAPDILKELKSKYKEKFQYALANAKGLLNHYIVCDSRLLRYEEKHEPITKDSEVDLIKANVYFNNPSIAKMMEDGFDTIWGD